MPTRWRAQTVRLAHAAAQLRAGRGVWASPDVLTVGGWLRREAERAATAQSPRLLSAAEEWFLWRQCAGEITAQLPLVNGASLGEALQRSSRLAAEYDIELRPGPAGSEAQLLHAAQRAFAERCGALEAVTADALLSAAPSGAPGGAAITQRGFDPLPPRLAALVAQRTAPLASAARERAQPMAAPAVPQVIRAADLFEELERIAAWCQELVARDSQARLLVMLPGAAGPRVRLAALIRQALDPRGSLDRAGAAPSLAGIESGEPLSRQPLIAHALTTLSLLGGEELEAVRFGAWLRAACWSAPPEGARARLDLQLREYRWTGVRLRELLGTLMLQKHGLRVFAQELHTRLVRASAALDAGAQTRASPRVWSERFRAALQAAGWPGAMDVEAAGQQALVSWHELLEAFGGLNASASTLAREEALRLLTGLAGSNTFHPAPEDVTVTISPTLADPVVSYDGIWVAGLHADVLPQPVAPDPFLPLAAQQAAGIPAASAAGRLAQARTLLAAWRAGTAQLVLSAAERAGDVELLPSPMLQTTPAAPAHTMAWLPAALHREGLLESVTDATGVPWNARQTLPLGTRSLDLQNSCPFRAYAELRLGSEQPDTPEPGVPASERGKLLHGALERLWRRLRGSVGLERAHGAPLEAFIAQSVEEAAAELLANIPEQGRRRRRSGEGQIDMFAAMPRTLVRECARARRVIAALCEEERARAPFIVQAVEHGVDFVLGRARARLRIDRVDLLESGGRAVIDYKSGRFRTGAWQDERPTWPQLLAYQHALGAEVTALATAWVSTRACRFDGATRDARVFPRVRAVRAAPGATVADGWRMQRAAWGAVLERLTAGLLAGDATVDPKPGACTHCHVSNICRIAERAPEEPDPPPEEEP